MSDYSGSFPPPPEDPPAYTGSFPPPPEEPAYAGSFPPPTDAPPPVEVEAEPEPVAPQGRLGTFDLGLDVTVAPPPQEAADEGPAHVADAVLLTYTGLLTAAPFNAISMLAASNNLPGGVLLDLVRGPMGQDTDHPAHRLERGEISAQQFADQLEERLAELGATIDYETQIRPLLIDLDLNEIVVEYILDIRQEGYRTGLVMNASREVAMGRRQLVPVHALFDVVVESWNQGIRKPNRVMYAQAIRLLGIEDPQRVVVLDPSLQNVEAARSAGAVGIQVVRDPVQALRQLNVHLGRSTAAGLSIAMDET